MNFTFLTLHTLLHRSRNNIHNVFICGNKLQESSANAIKCIYVTQHLAAVSTALIDKTYKNEGADVIIYYLEANAKNLTHSTLKQKCIKFNASSKTFHSH